MMRESTLFLFLCLAAPAIGQTAAPASYDDARTQVIDHYAGQTVEVRAAAGYQLTVEFPRDEQVLNIAVGNSNAWQVSVNSRRNLVFVKPNQGAPNTNMTVFTNSRSYNFELRASPILTGDMPFNIRFRTAQATAVDADGFVTVAARPHPAGLYRVTGEAALRPNSISHDGRFTFVTWPKERDLPATYEIGPTGEELLVNGIMRDDILVIDRVVTKLRFRRDRKLAEAVLVQNSGKRR